MADSPTSLRARTSALARVAAPQSASAKLALVNRRDRLRDFQAGLAEKLRRAEATPLAVNRLGFQIGSRRLLVGLADAGEILTVPDIMPVPLTKSWYRGLANVRGNLFGVVDLSLFAGGPPTPLDKESRLLAFSGDLRFACGILVSRMLGLRNVSDLTAAPVGGDAQGTRPAAVDDLLFAPWVRARLVDAQAVAWQEFDLAALTADPRFLDIART
jgi:twitching motility protein PilI